ncbi:TolC family protein [Solimonas soli]|uniref:TolC family protein n=1 Tax=Solimonas soli TaxID=413479 RepID=UPI0004B65296|nr:TolC family protein [Solimonas soli]
MFVPRLLPAMLGASLLLGACAGLPTERGRQALAADVAARGLALPEAPPDAADPVAAWLGAPLSVDRAIQIALLRNPELRAETATLGLAAAEVYEAGRLANPLLSATWLSRGDDPHAQLTLGIAVNFTDLLLLRSRARIADAEFERTRLAIGGAALDLAARVEAAYRRVVAAAQLAELRRALAGHARTAATLAQRYADAGNLPRRDLALEQAAASEAELDADADARDLALARGALQRLLGLQADASWTLAETLALPPADDEALADLQRLARDSRLDIAAARRHVDALAARYGLTRRTRALGEIAIGAEREREYDGGVHGGPTLSLALPLFDWGAGRQARGAAERRAAEAELAARTLDAERDVGAAYARLRTARTRVERYRRDVLPARETAVEQTQREFNYMLVDAFELLTVRRQGNAAYAGYLEALGDYWVARAELAGAVGRRLPLDGAAGPAALRFDDGRPRLVDAPPAAPANPHAHTRGDTQDEPAPMAATEHRPDCAMQGMNMAAADAAAAHERMMATCAGTAPAAQHGDHDGQH